MVRKCWSYLLIAMIAMQSVGAITATDDHQTHQDGNQHLEFEHEHQPKTVNEAANTIEELYSYLDIEFDCHHCCHCHNFSQCAVLSKNESLNLALLYLTSEEFYAQYISSRYSPELRPPIV